MSHLIFATRALLRLLYSSFICPVPEDQERKGRRKKTVPRLTLWPSRILAWVCGPASGGPSKSFSTSLECRATALVTSEGSCDLRPVASVYLPVTERLVCEGLHRKRKRKRGDLGFEKIPQSRIN